MLRRRVRRGPAAAFPNAECIDISVKFQAALVRKPDRHGQGVPARVAAEVRHAGRSEAIGPRVQPGRVIGVGRGAHLQEDHIEAGAGRMLDQRLQPRPFDGRTAQVEARDPECAHLEGQGRLRVELPQVGQVGRLGHGYDGFHDFLSMDDLRASQHEQKAQEQAQQGQRPGCEPAAPRAGTHTPPAFRLNSGIRGSAWPLRSWLTVLRKCHLTDRICLHSKPPRRRAQPLA